MKAGDGVLRTFQTHRGCSLRHRPIGSLNHRDPWLDRPAIRFANDLPVINGWTILSKIKRLESLKN
jgi:hypothetical protein